MKRKILFYDRVCVNFRKYIPDIIEQFASKKNYELLLVYDEGDSEDIEFFKQKGIKTYKTHFFEKHYNILKVFKPDILLVNAQRISDSSLVVYAKKYNIKTIMIQHGMYVPFMKREKTFFIEKFFMIIRYLFYAFSISKLLNISFFNTINSLFKVFVLGRNYKDTVTNSKALNVDFVFVYGEYWKEYHNNVFNYRLNQQFTIGYHELLKVENINKKVFEKGTICYIAQTLVEDGRFKEHDFKIFVENLKSLAKDFKIYVKLHPRSNLDFYSNSDLILTENEIPNCEYFLGHYSSLLALFAHVKGNLITWEFEGHPIPIYFEKISYKTNKKKDLINYLNSINNKDVEDIDYYFSNTYSTKKVISLIEGLVFQT